VDYSKAWWPEVPPARVAEGSEKKNRTLETALRGSGQAGCGTQNPKTKSSFRKVAWPIPSWR